MTAEIATLDTGALEQLIYQVRGVHAARVVITQDSRIDEVHVVGTPRRSAKQIVRDIESILYVRGGVRVDHRKISLVQIPDVVIRPALPRVQIVEVIQSDSDESASITVKLSVHEQQAQGTGSSRPNRPADPPLLAAYATVHALNSLLGPRGRLQLERLQRQTLGAIEVYLAHLSLQSDDELQTLLGISALRDDELQSVARAVLDAVNRMVGRLLAEGQGPGGART